MFGMVFETGGVGLMGRGLLFLGDLGDAFCAYTIEHINNKRVKQNTLMPQ
jgi:hypothetical protein